MKSNKKADGFDDPQKYEEWVDSLNMKANLILKKNDPARFHQKYKERTGDKYLKLQS